MKALVCPDSFKGSMTALEAAQAIKRGLDDIHIIREAELLPMADGGEGTTAIILNLLSDRVETEFHECRTLDPLRREITVRYPVIRRKTAPDNAVAIIEAAMASGLNLVRKEERDILRADTYGTGLIIADAYRRGVRDFYVALGGSATCDAGIGAYEAMIGTVKSPVNITLLCDVENPLCGLNGAARVFGPQKGATPEMMPALESRIEEAANLFLGRFGADMRLMPKAGAAGGLAAMLMAAYGASAVSGIEKILELADFDRRLQEADIVITGEGRCDVTTLQGKVASGILHHASDAGKPVILIGGSVKDREKLLSAGFAEVIQATPTKILENRVPTGEEAQNYLTEAVKNLLTLQS